MPAMVDGEADQYVGEISTFVHVEFQGRGIGRALSEITLIAARRKGFRKIIASIRADNRNAIAFYSSQGFQVVKSTPPPVLVRGCFVDVVVAEKILD